MGSLYINGKKYSGVSSLVKSGSSISYCTCNTEASISEKIIECENFNLDTGALIAVKFINTNTASNVTLNVNNTGAKSIYYDNSIYTESSKDVCGYADRHIYYMYNGTAWVWVTTGAKVSSGGSSGGTLADWAVTDEDDPAFIRNKDLITVELTKDEYDALSEEEKNNGTIYLVTDELVREADDITLDSIRNALGYIPVNPDDAVYHEDNEDINFDYVSNRTNLRVTELETAALYCDVTDEDRGIVPKTSADLLGGEISAQDIKELLIDALLCNVDDADRGNKPATTTDLLGGEISAEDVNNKVNYSDILSTALINSQSLLDNKVASALSVKDTNAKVTLLNESLTELAPKKIGVTFSNGCTSWADGTYLIVNQRMITLKISISSAVAAAGTQLFTIPTQYAPNDTIFAPIVDLNDGMSSLRINATGSVLINNNTPLKTTGIHNGTICWFK